MSNVYLSFLQKFITSETKAMPNNLQCLLTFVHVVQFTIYNVFSLQNYSLWLFLVDIKRHSLRKTNTISCYWCV